MIGLAQSGLWAIEQGFFQTLLPQLQLPQQPQKAYDVPMGLQQKAGYFDDPEGYLVDWYRAKSQKSVVVLPLMGVMSRKTSWANAWGNEMLARLIARADQTDDVKGTVLDTYSPGGTVDATQLVAEAVANCAKPVVVWTPFCASAAYWVASQADEIVMEAGVSNQVGSIGTMYVHTDLTGVADKTGVSTTIFRASGSPDKLKPNPFEALDDSLKTQIVDQLTASRAEFVKAVRRGRGGKLVSSEALTGKLYRSDAALKLGLVDGFGPMAKAVQRVLQLSKGRA